MQSRFPVQSLAISPRRDLQWTKLWQDSVDCDKFMLVLGNNGVKHISLARPRNLR
jgi:hypothetical protein